MPPVRVLALLSLGALAADPPSALRVIRVTPLSEASPGSVITVTFDRPVTGSLDRTVDPAGLLEATPAIEGTLEWRDPVTLRFRPAKPLEPGRSYRLTVKPDFTAIDGSALAEPYRFGFRVAGPTLLAGLPIGPGASPKYLPANPSLDLVLSSAASAEAITRLIHLEIAASSSCKGGIVPVELRRQIAIPDSASWELKNAGGWDRDKSGDSLRRLVTVRPTEPLPLGCFGSLVAPAHLDAESPGGQVRWPFGTYGAFHLLSTGCGSDRVATCPAGPISLEFSTPVNGAALLRQLKVLPAVKLSVPDTADTRDRWMVWADLKPKTGYLVELGAGLTDQFGQPLAGNPRGTVVTTSFAPEISYLAGRLTVERNGARTLPVTYVNVDTLEVLSVAIPDSLEAKLLGTSWYGWTEDWKQLEKRATRRKFAVRAPRDRHGVFGVPFPVPDARVPRAATLFAVKVTSPALPRRKRETGDEETADAQPVALIQVTDLGVHAKIGPEEGVVWVTGASDGKARPGAQVRIKDQKGRLLGQAVTDAQGIARFNGVKRRATAAGTEEGEGEAFEGLVDVRLGADRAVIGVNEYDPELGLWRFNVSGAWGVQRFPAAAAVFTERGIYRPGDSVFAKVIARSGPLGSLVVPARTDSVKLTFQDRDDGVLFDRVLALSPFGTAAPVVKLPNDAPLGTYRVAVSLKRTGSWQTVATTEYRVAEYRAPEFLVDVTADTAAKESGESLSATVAARYLFGAPMARARVTWSLRQQSIDPWELQIPNTEGYQVGASGWWYEEYHDRITTQVVESHQDSLDATGHLSIKAPVELTRNGQSAARISVEAVVTDVNRQTVFGSASTIVHPASFYLGAKPTAASYFWPAKSAQSVQVIAVRPNGRRIGDVPVKGSLIRREWHQVRRENDGYAETVGEWVADTVDRCAITVVADGSLCRLTPPSAGSYTVSLAATDAKGRPVVTSFYRWVTGPGFVPWADETQFKMDVIPDRSRYSVGDTATVLFASPFTQAEAWIAVEREGIIEQRRVSIADGATTIKFPITEAWAPNAFVSIVVARGRSAKPGPLDDPGRPTIRVGYAEVRVTPERKRLTVALAADRAEYRPGDQATITGTVTDRGRGARSELTVWAVDEGVLSLTGYRTPDPIDLLYQPRGLGLRLASNLSNVVPQVAAGDKGRNPGGGGGGGGFDEVLRSRFRTTAFFLGSIVTDSSGVGVAKVRLPDNLTTFRLMAVAVTAGDRFGSGHSPLLVTRPLLARAALPRFLRPGDRALAGVVVNHRIGGTPSVQVDAKVTGVALEGPSSKTGTLEAGRGRELRFDFRGQPGDSAVFRFDVAGAGDKDALRLAIPIKPAHRARVSTIAGTVVDSTEHVAFELGDDIDVARSRLSLNLGASPLALLKGYSEDLEVYPYFCSEQVSSVGMPLIALYRARKQAGTASGDTVRLRQGIDRAVAMLTRRQRDDGAIGYWSADDWSSAWLTAHAGMVLLEAKAAGIPVRDSVLAGIATYLTTSLARQRSLAMSVALDDAEPRVVLAERVAVVEYLSRAGKRNRAAENDLLRQVGQLAPEDRMRLAVTLARAGDIATGRRLLEPYWAQVKVEGRTATLPDSLHSRFYFRSTVGTVAELLLATIAIEPSHRLLGPLLESVATRGRTTPVWNTRDYAAAVRAVDAWQRRFPPAELPSLRIRSNGKLIFASVAGRGVGDSSLALGSLVKGRERGPVRLDIESSKPGAVGFYYLSLTEVPTVPPVRPEDKGFIVERWFEDYASGKPIGAATEGDLVRVRIKVTVPVDRAFVVIDDPLPAGLEAIDLSLRTVGGLPLPGGQAADSANGDASSYERWDFGSWDAGWWSPFDHRELRDDRVIYSARVLWKGSYTATYLARATTPGLFVRPQTYAEEMYNPAVFGRSEGGTFQVRVKTP